MFPTNTQIKDEAIQTLTNQWGNSALAIFVIGLISSVGGFIPFAGLIIGGPIALGVAKYFLRLSRGEKMEISNMFDGFKEFGNAIGAYILMLLIVVFGIILLIIPGIIAALALSQTYKIMHDEPELGAIDAMKKSHELMKGHRGDYFIFCLSFIGWAFLCILTLGIGFFFLGAYFSTASSIYYNNLIGYKKNKELDELASHLITH